MGCGIQQLDIQERLVTKNSLHTDGKKVRDPELKKRLLPKPNSTLLFFPLKRKLFTMAHANPEAQFESWLKKLPKRKQHLEKWFSAKQIRQLKKYTVNFNKWLKNNGEPPAIVDSTQMQQSVVQVNQYYKNKGYFNSATQFKVEPKGKRGANVHYTTTRGNRFYLDRIDYAISSPALRPVIQTAAGASFLQQDSPFVLENFEKERERLINLLKTRGVYNFQPNSLQFTVAIDSTGRDTKIPVTVNISDYNSRSNDSVQRQPYQLSKVQDIKVFISPNDDFTTANWDSINYEDMSIFYKGKLKYRPQALAESIFIQKDSLYNNDERTLTYRFLNRTRNFKYPSITYQPLDAETLEANILLTPRERFSLGLDLDVSHSNIQDFGVGSGASIAVRNLFRSTDVLEFSINNTLGASNNAANPKDRFFNLFELGADINLRFPKILLPFDTEGLVPKEMNPQTSITLGSTIQTNIGLDKQYLNSTYQLDWTPSKTRNITLKLLDIEFVNNRNVTNYFNVYKNSYKRLNTIAGQTSGNQIFYNSEGNLRIPEGTDGFIAQVLAGGTGLQPEDTNYILVNRIRERQERLTVNNLIVGTSFGFTLNTQEDLLDENFSQFRFKLETVGNGFMGLLSVFNHPKNDQGNYAIDGVEPSQYIKTELDYIKHIRLGTQRVLALRLFGGFALPYNNANSIPFTRSFFGGGANDNRAWKPYQLGPGKSNNTNEFNEANLKLAANLEYRFPIINALKGALFIDAGNIWNAQDNVTDPLARFDGFRDLEDIAIGSGLGLRYDFDFFVFRFDTAFKTYNPALPKATRWWSEYALNKAVFNVGINYPF